MYFTNIRTMHNLKFWKQMMLPNNSSYFIKLIRMRFLPPFYTVKYFSVKIQKLFWKPKRQYYFRNLYEKKIPYIPENFSYFWNNAFLNFPFYNRYLLYFLEIFISLIWIVSDQRRIIFQRQLYISFTGIACLSQLSVNN